MKTPSALEGALFEPDRLPGEPDVEGAGTPGRPHFHVEVVGGAGAQVIRQPEVAAVAESVRRYSAENRLRALYVRAAVRPYRV